MNRVLGALLAAVLVLGAGAAGVESTVSAASATELDERIPGGDTSQAEGSETGGDPADPPAEELDELDAPLVMPSIIGGAAAVGTAAVVHPGEWDQPEASFAYQWLSSGEPIAGATSDTYVPRPAEVGATLQAAVTVSTAGSGERTVVTAGVTVGPGTLTAATPVITGTAAVGTTLRVGTGTWDPASTQLSVQWTRNGTAIAGATTNSYVPTASDLGARIGATVQGSALGYLPLNAMSAPTKPVAAGTLTAATPKITGSAVVGKALRASVASWAPAGTTVSFQWKRNGVTIPGATKSSYTVASADSGTRITVTATGSLAGYTRASRTSAATAAVLRAFSSTPVPRVSGAVRVGSTLTALVKATTPAATSVSYRWYRNGSAISGATRSTYRLTASDGGTQITVRATSTRSGYASATTTSATHRVPMVLRAATPTISGAATVGSQVRVSAGSWTPGTALTYRWYRNGAAIAGAQGASYRITAGDRGASLTVAVTGKKSGYAAETRTSRATATVKYPSRTTPSGWNCPSWALIKGNASSMIYHLPGGASYTRTNPEECFATESAAQRAGYRRALR